MSEIADSVLWIALAIGLAGWWISAAIKEFTEGYRDTHYGADEEEEE